MRHLTKYSPVTTIKAKAMENKARIAKATKFGLKDKALTSLVLLLMPNVLLWCSSDALLSVFACDKDVMCLP